MRAVLEPYLYCRCNFLEKGVSRSAADKIIDSISDELLTGSKRFKYGRSYAMLLGALRKHLKNDCVAMGPSERFD